MWTPESHTSPCIMDAIIQARENYRGTVNCIRDETVRLINACRLWIRANYVDDILDDEKRANPDYLFGTKQCDTDIQFPHQLRPPEWVWRVWQQTLRKVFLYQKDNSGSWFYYDIEIPVSVLDVF